MSSNNQKAIEILQFTNDGDLLSSKHLRLVEMAVNGHLNVEGEEAFAALHQEVMAGTYTRPWFHGIENLIRLETGYVTWKGVVVEHYSFSIVQDEKAAAERLGAHCRMLEEKGVPVDSRTATEYEMFSAFPKESPWLQTLLCYYTAFADSEGKCKWLIVNTEGHHAIAISVVCGEIVTQYALSSDFDFGSYTMFHRLQGEGFKSCGDRLRTYDGFVAAMTEAGITPEIVSRALAAGIPQALLPA